ncbi:hypothetical protein OESDEN_21097 [Oesophagostomum dentatum]|uniref:Uncharacterized protein n=1 Tax=Oesophagostomum dentatum TaxID=61180 RepID=A0A0B1S7S4_OESDE|nr:hypothetical protein OESDEN_21097 [Oesophagostomum dentatum]
MPSPPGFIAAQIRNSPPVSLILAMRCLCTATLFLAITWASVSCYDFDLRSILSGLQPSPLGDVEAWPWKFDCDRKCYATISGGFSEEADLTRPYKLKKICELEVLDYEDATQRGFCQELVSTIFDSPELLKSVENTMQSPAIDLLNKMTRKTVDVCASFCLSSILRPPKH